VSRLQFLHRKRKKGRRNMRLIFENREFFLVVYVEETNLSLNNGLFPSPWWSQKRAIFAMLCYATISF
jgi:hypothetical protein